MTTAKHDNLIVLASRNAKKIREMMALLVHDGLTVRGVDAFPEVAEVVEDGVTFAENAAKKAREVAVATGHWAIGEDSGLMVDALNGAPGIYSARYGGPGTDDARNNAKLIDALAGVPLERRGAQYVCSIAFARPDGAVVAEAEARCCGRFVDVPRGTNGFGYDPHFEIRELHQTFGELPAVVKQHISHRARACARFLPRLRVALRTAELPGEP